MLSVWLGTLGLSPLVLPCLFAFLGGPRLARPGVYMLVGFVVLALGAVICVMQSFLGAGLSHAASATDAQVALAMSAPPEYSLALYMSAALAFLVGLRAVFGKRAPRAGRE